MEKAEGTDAHTRERLEAMLEFFEMSNAWAEQVQKTPTPILLKAVKMGERVFKLLGLTN